jgi:hypothetical protein
MKILVENDLASEELSSIFNQNYWVFGLFPLSSILRNGKHDISETEWKQILLPKRHVSIS